MIPKSVQRFSEKIMLHQKLERDDDSKKRHPALVVDKLQAGYGPAQVLFDVTFAVRAGEVVTLLGRNGMGKTTTIKTLMGMLPARGGSARFGDEDLLGRPSYRVAQRGLGLVPEGRQIFPTLSVEENLVATAAARSAAAKWTLRQVYDFFPRLAERRANMGNQLSGGEQQMLAIGRALMTNPKLLILDEATEGLAPLIRAEIWACLARLKQEGQAILLVDKHLDALTKIADRHVVIEKGCVVWTGTSQALVADKSVRERYLQV
jgi:branched-chain amino acid transport system ATP-binding protein